MSIESFRILMEKAHQLEALENRSKESQLRVPGQKNFPNQTVVRPGQSAAMWGDITVKNQMERDLEIKIHFNPFDKKGFSIKIYDAKTHELLMEKKGQIHSEYIIQETLNHEIAATRKQQSAKKSFRELRNFNNFA